ncbi:hypothetical protein PYW07_015692 [Mythimna separata]|uniref:FP protein C-terminal domain-containing protein n=1 Tax=Mythimna separata TaxID=271217 RepID=A0AAD8DUN0_MYTSE|nr:hypothetical protein PYW07_015692 [Mythimna separata]
MSWGGAAATRPVKHVGAARRVREVDTRKNFSSEENNWLCPTCKPKIRNTDNTPVRYSHGDPNITLRKKGSSTNLSVDITPKEAPVTSIEVNRIMKKQIDDLMRHLNETLANYVNKELKAITDKIEGLKASMSFMNEKFEEMKTEFSLNTKVVSNMKKENEQLKASVKDLSGRLNQMEQQARSSNLEIQCLPEHHNENLVSTVMNINRVISCNLTEDSIHHVTRIAKQNPSSKRPKSIVVQFSSPRVRDNFLAASIKFNKNKTIEEKLNTALLGIGGKKENVFIVEHLSPANKALHAATRIKAKSLGYQYVWVRGGKIFVRKADGSDYKFIKDIETLDKLQ